MLVRIAHVALLVVAAVSCESAPKEREVAHAAPPTTTKLEAYACGSVQRLHTLDGVFLGSQPAAADLEQAKSGGIRAIVDLRPASEERGFDEPAIAASLGLAYHSIPFQKPEELTDDVLDRARALFRDPANRPMFVHCSSGNRVGAVWLAHRVLDGGLAWDDALAEAHLVGLKLPAYESRVRDYVRRNAR